MKHENETWVESSQQLVNVDYSYWTLSYVLSKSGAEKLLKGKPFDQLVPVDEYLPIMYNKHPESRWKEAFSNRNLKVNRNFRNESSRNVFSIYLFYGILTDYFLLQAYSIAPLLVYPTHYTGEVGYISDTESSEIVPDVIKSITENGKTDKVKKGSKEVGVEEHLQLQDLAAAISTSTPKIEDVSKEIHSEL